MSTQDANRKPNGSFSSIFITSLTTILGLVSVVVSIVALPNQLKLIGILLLGASICLAFFLSAIIFQSLRRKQKIERPPSTLSIPASSLPLEKAIQEEKRHRGLSYLQAKQKRYQTWFSMNVFVTMVSSPLWMILLILLPYNDHWWAIIPLVCGSLSFLLAFIFLAATDDVTRAIERIYGEKGAYLIDALPPIIRSS